MDLNEAKQLLKNNGFRLINESGNNLDLDGDFLTYAARIDEGSKAIYAFIDKLYKQIPEDIYRENDYEIDQTISKIENVFTAKGFLGRLTYEPGPDAVLDFVAEHEEEFKQVVAENPTMTKYITRF